MFNVSIYHFNSTQTREPSSKTATQLNDDTIYINSKMGKLKKLLKSMSFVFMAPEVSYQ